MCQLPEDCVGESMSMGKGQNSACAVDFISRPRTANSRAKQKLPQPPGHGEYREYKDRVSGEFRVNGNFRKI